MPDQTDTPEPPIINCHTHLFTREHSPRDFPNAFLAFLGRIPWLPGLLENLMLFLGRENLAETLGRLRAFGRTGGRRSQQAVFEELRRYYPRSARFVVLPLDMRFTEHGPVAKDIDQQLEELATLAQSEKFGDQIIPFATLDPRDPDGVSRFKTAIESGIFKGLKLYPRMGFWPNDPVLMKEVYPYCVEHNLPVLSHCSRGGVTYKPWTYRQLDKVTDPRAFIPVLDEFNELRLNLAHFGGVADWHDYLEKGVDPDPDGPPQTSDNWVTAIRDMLRNEKYENLYTDISYTVFSIPDFVPILDMLLNESRIRNRVLFGSDFYMTRQEAVSEKALSMRLRSQLGEDKFWQIAHYNPKAWLAET